MLLGDGRTVLRPAAGRVPLQVAPTVRRLVLARLELQDIDLRIGTENAGALRFDSVRLRGVTIGLGTPLLVRDSLVSGTLKDLVQKRRGNE